MLEEKAWKEPCLLTQSTNVTHTLQNMTITLDALEANLLFID